MENQEKLLQFVEWLGQNVPELKGQDPEQIVSTINELTKSDEGKQMLQGLIQEFESSMTSMFKKGGKLDYLLCLKSGGNIQDCGCGKKIDKKQPGGSIASRIWNRIVGKDTYIDGYGTKRQHAPVRESTHRTIVNAADSPLVQAIPVVGDIADGYVAADYAAKGDYKPAIAAIGAGLILPDMLESGARYIPKDTWRDALKKFDDVDLNHNITSELSDDVKKYLDDIKSGKVKLTKDISELTDNEKELLLENLQRGSHRIPSQRIDLGPVDHDIDKIWMPENPNIIGKTDIGNIAASKSVEPWWGWDPVEYQEGGEIMPRMRNVMEAGRDMGLTNSQTRQAYRNQKAAIRRQGFKGREMRQAARYNIVDSAYPQAVPERIPIERVAAGPFIQTPTNRLVSQETTGLAGNRPVQARPEYFTFQGDFDTAFGNARKMGVDKFYWAGDGGLKTTELAQPKPESAAKQTYDYNQNVVENTLEKPGIGNKVKASMSTTLNYPMK